MSFDDIAVSGEDFGWSFDEGGPPLTSGAAGSGGMSNDNAWMSSALKGLVSAFGDNGGSLGGGGKTSSQSVQQSNTQQSAVNTSTVINVSSPESSLSPGFSPSQPMTPSISQAVDQSARAEPLPSLGLVSGAGVDSLGVDVQATKAGLLDNPMMLIALGLGAVFLLGDKGGK